jgi:transposase
LLEDGSLAKFDRAFHVLNPKQVKKFKDIHPDLPKNDPVDAFVIADNLRFGRITRQVYMDDYRYKALQTLTRARFRHVHNLNREKQRFMNLLFLKFSGLAQEQIFSNNYGATALALFEQFQTPDELAAMNLDELAD